MLKYKTFRTYFKSKPDFVISDAMYTVHCKPSSLLFALRELLFYLFYCCCVAMCACNHEFQVNNALKCDFFGPTNIKYIYLTRLAFVLQLNGMRVWELCLESVKYRYFIRFARKRLLLLRRQIFVFQLKHQIFVNSHSLEHLAFGVKIALSLNSICLFLGALCSSRTIMELLFRSNISFGT